MESKNPLKVAYSEDGCSELKCVTDKYVLFVLGMSLLSLVGFVGVVSTKSPVFGLILIVGVVSLLVVGFVGSFKD